VGINVEKCAHWLGQICAVYCSVHIMHDTDKLRFGKWRNIHITDKPCDKLIHSEIKLAVKDMDPPI
jgi:hypothetical protein